MVSLFLALLALPSCPLPLALGLLASPSCPWPLALGLVALASWPWPLALGLGLGLLLNDAVGVVGSWYRGIMVSW